MPPNYDNEIPGRPSGCGCAAGGGVGFGVGRRKRKRNGRPQRLRTENVVRAQPPEWVSRPGASSASVSVGENENETGRGTDSEPKTTTLPIANARFGVEYLSKKARIWILAFSGLLIQPFFPNVSISSSVSLPLAPSAWGRSHVSQIRSQWDFFGLGPAPVSAII